MLLHRQIPYLLPASNQGRAKQVPASTHQFVRRFENYLFFSPRRESCLLQQTSPMSILNTIFLASPRCFEEHIQPIEIYSKNRQVDTHSLVHTQINAFTHPHTHLSSLQKHARTWTSRHTQHTCRHTRTNAKKDADGTTTHKKAQCLQAFQPPFHPFPIQLFALLQLLASALPSPVIGWFHRLSSSTHR